jgi:hypothetical protein
MTYSYNTSIPTMINYIKELLINKKQYLDDKEQNVYYIDENSSHFLTSLDISYFVKYFC